MLGRIRTSWGDSELWEREYSDLQVIPSSTRQLPSKALLQYEGLLDFSTSSPVLDVGCGNGRNALYFASKGCQVCAVDASAVALDVLKAASRRYGFEDRIDVKQIVLTERWPFQSGQFSLTLDSYVFCHILDDAQRASYRDELRRVTRAGGLIYTSSFCVDDEYYAQMASPSQRIVCDPANGLAKRLYTELEYASFFSEACTVRYQTTFRFDDIVQGRPYRRSIITLLLSAS
jgi:SAM-dependent methyltransferase